MSEIKSNLHLPKIGFSVAEFNRLETPQEKIKFLWNRFSETTNEDRNNWEFIKSVTKGTLTILRLASTNKEFKKYLGTVGQLVDIADLGFSLQNIFVPHYRKPSVSPNEWMLPYFPGAKKGWDIRSLHLKDSSSLLETLWDLSPEKLKEINIEVEDISKEVVEKDGVESKGTFRKYLLTGYISEHVAGELSVPFIVEKYPLTKLQDMEEGAPEYTLFCYKVYCEEYVRRGKAGTDLVSAAIIANYVLAKAFILTCDFNNNYLHVVGGNYDLQPRSNFKVPFKITNVDIEGLSNCYHNVIENNSKWGVGLIGDAGTGKTTAVHEFINNMPGVPIFWVDSSVFSYRNYLIKLFQYISLIPGCIVVFDDMDSSEKLGEKTEMVGLFITLLADKRNSFFMLSTINDPRLIDSTLLDRPQRVDEVIRIDRPGKEEVALILEHLESQHSVEDNEQERTALIEKIVEADLTHVQVDSIYRKSFNYSKKGEALTYESLNNSLKGVIESSENAYKVRKKGKLVDSE